MIKIFLKWLFLRPRKTEPIKKEPSPAEKRLINAEWTKHALERWDERCSELDKNQIIEGARYINQQELKQLKKEYGKRKSRHTPEPSSANNPIIYIISSGVCFVVEHIAAIRKDFILTVYLVIKKPVPA